MQEEKTGSLVEPLREALRLLEHDVEGANRVLEGLYAADMVFHDPLQLLRGREAFLEMNRRLSAGARELRFELCRAVETEDDIFLVWTMVFKPKGGPRLNFEGTSHLRLRDGQVVYHRDYWDLLGSLAASVPGLGRLYRMVLQKIA